MKRGDEKDIIELATVFHDSRLGAGVEHVGDGILTDSVLLQFVDQKVGENIKPGTLAVVENRTTAHINGKNYGLKDVITGTVL